MKASRARPDRRDAAADQRFGASAADQPDSWGAGVRFAAIGSTALDLTPAVAAAGSAPVDRLEGEQRWIVLARARADGSPGLIAAAEDAVFRCFLPLAAAMAAGTDDPATCEPERAAELGLAQAVLAWRRPDGVGFEEFARRSIGSRLRIASTQAWTTPRSTTLGRVPAQSGSPSRPTGAGPRRQSVEVAMLDRTGVIVSVNDAWREFSAANGGNGSRTGVGMSYLAICDAAGDDVHAREVSAAIRAAAGGDLPSPITIVVPCHSPAVQRWYDVLVSPRLNRQFRTIGVAVTLTLRASAPVR